MKNIFDSWKAITVCFIIFIFLTILSVVFLSQRPNINPIYSTFFISILGTTIILVCSYFFSKVIFNKKYSPAHAELFPSISNKKYNYKKILGNTSIKNIFISDQNLHILTQDKDAIDDDYKSLIFNLLKNGANVYLMLCNLNNEIIKTWGKFTSKSYRKHLSKSREILKDWKKEYNDSENKKGTFTIFTAPFVPLNIIAIDFMDLSDNSKIIIIPIFFNMPEYRSRPIFVLEYKKHPKSFEMYRDKISQIIIEGYEGIKEL